MKAFEDMALGLCAIAALTGHAYAGAGCDAAAGIVDYQVVPLDPLVGTTFAATAMNNAAEVAGLIFPNGGDPARVFVWADGVVKRRDLPGPAAGVLGLNEDGVVVGLANDGKGLVPFVWNPDNDKFQFVPAPIEVFPQDINERGLIVGGDLAGLQGFALESPGGNFTSIVFGALPKQGVGTLGAQAVNGSGVVVGSEVIFLDKQGFFQETPYSWTEAGGIQALPTLNPGFGGRAVDVAEDGTIVGLVFDDVAGKQTALWPAEELRGTVLNLGSPFNFFVSEATAVNVAGQIAVVAPNDLFGFTRGFLWDSGEFIDLSCFAPPGLFVLRPLDVNDAGDVLVQLGDAQGLTVLNIVILRPVPAGPIGDIDGDGDVDTVDFLALLAAWGPCGGCPADLNGDGAVDTIDFLLLLENWTG